MQNHADVRPPHSTPFISPALAAPRTRDEWNASPPQSRLVWIALGENPALPRAGDAVRWLRPDDSTLLRRGMIGIINGFLVDCPAVAPVIFNASSIFRGPSHPDAEMWMSHVSCSGGPGLDIDMDQLTPTKEFVALKTWHWGPNGPGADQGISARICVRLWDYPEQGEAA